MIKLTVIGYLGKDPEIRFTPEGQQMTTFSVAASRRSRDANGEYKQETEWFNVAAWGKTAELCQSLLEKGQQIYLEGRLSTRNYTDRDGNPRTSLNINLSEFQLVGNRQQRQNQESAQGPHQPPNSAQGNYQQGSYQTNQRPAQDDDYNDINEFNNNQEATRPRPPAERNQMEVDDLPF